MLLILAPPTAFADAGGTGDDAGIIETFQILSRMNGNVFSVVSIDDASVRGIVAALERAADGKPSAITWGTHTHRVAARPVTVRIRAGWQFGTVAAAMFRPQSSLEGNVTFTPERGSLYLVRGCIALDYQAVWIEDVHGKPVAAPITNGQPTGTCVGATEPPRTAQAAFDRTTGGETKDVLIRRLGEPTAVLEVPDTSSFFAGPQPRQLDYRYEGRGRVRLVEPRDEDAETFVLTVTSDSVDADEIGRAIHMLVDRGDIALVRALAMGLNARGVSDIETLDAFAARAWRERAAHDPLTIDTIAYVFELIGASGRARYRALLEHFRDDESRDDKLARYARRALERLMVENVEQFPLTQSATPPAPPAQVE